MFKHIAEIEYCRKLNRRDRYPRFKHAKKNSVGVGVLWTLVNDDLHIQSLRKSFIRKFLGVPTDIEENFNE